MEVMTRLEKSVLHSVREEFVGHASRVLDLHSFVSIMLKYLKKKGMTKTDVIDIVDELCDLFDRVDINGDGSMDWGE